MKELIEKKERNYCLDFIKGIACICVVFMHCEFPGILGTLVQCVSRFSVPFFFMVSGYYCFYDKDLTNKQKLEKAIKKISHLCIIILGAIFLYTIYAFIRGGVQVSLIDIRNFILFNVPFIIAGQMWFLFALLYDYIIYAIVDRCKLYKIAYIFIPILIVMYIALAQGAHLLGITVPNMIYRNFAIEGFCFFMIGNFLHRYQDKVIIKNYILLIIIAVSTLLCPVERLLMGRDFGVNVVTFPQVIAIFLYGLNNPKKFYGHFIQKVGTKLSMLIYILHPAVWYLFEFIYNRLQINENIVALYAMPILVLFGTAITAFIVSVILEKFKRKKAKNV